LREFVKIAKDKMRRDRSFLGNIDASFEQLSPLMIFDLCGSPRLTLG
jgi:hypothetical protein